MTWAHFEGVALSREQSHARIDALKWTDWKPQGITLHNTAAPTLAQWAESGPNHDARIRNLQNYYENELGWHAGPHFFISRAWINWFSNPLLPGVHSRCWNATRFGIEMVGDFNAEEFNSGDGSLVRDNAVFLIAALNNKFGFKAEDLTFHVECKQDNHDCPGHKVVKSDVIRRVKIAMADIVRPTQPIPSGTGPSGSATPDAHGSGQPTAGPSSSISTNSDNAILKIAETSPLLRYSWAQRGVAPAGYIKGMAMTFALVLKKWQARDPGALLMAKAQSSKADTDALTWYFYKMKAAGLMNEQDGVDTLRHLFVLLLGLGMRESSGSCFEGRDTSADNVSSDTAEAGLFQQSHNSFAASPELPKLMAAYLANPTWGYLDIFREGVRGIPTPNYGPAGSNGAVFQRLCKISPSFAVEAAAIGLRVLRKHWGPINRWEAELVPGADKMLRDIQAIVIP